MEGCSKLWLRLILENFVLTLNWLTWVDLELLIDDFPYKGKDCNSKPPVMSAKKMQIKSSRNVIGKNTVDKDSLKPKYIC